MIERFARIFGTLLLTCGCVLVLSSEAMSQSTGPKAQAVAVSQIDDAGLTKVLKPNGKPLLVNFWATWCDPCREEFPELVKIDADYRGKIDFITVTLDEPEDIKGAVPKFLNEMKAQMPAYLLVAKDESATITSVAKDWTGGLPFTILYNDKGELAYFRQGKVKVDLLRAELDKIAAPVKAASH